MKLPKGLSFKDAQKLTGEAKNATPMNSKFYKDAILGLGILVALFTCWVLMTWVSVLLLKIIGLL